MCAEHSREIDRGIKERTADRRAVYKTRRWAGLRRTVLKKHPFCQHDGCSNLSTDVDHIVPLRDGGEPFELTNLQALCAMHHSRKTRSEVFRTKGSALRRTQ